MNDHDLTLRKRAEVDIWDGMLRRRVRDEAKALAANADLAELERLRRYLISGLQSKVNGRPLIEAIDDLAEQITGDRRALHARPHSIP